ncbi:MAG: FAD-dependent oxidoreductase [Deltaproteobacteria bacterium]|jgi:glycine/D-amino acid oxidase-like deaminating enzyme|nr:FAD-dependent oxidoreductase [Deltaproteobacteria bacterium]MBW2540500.1 FAD-dependent oxidoreductase [Deltaproteobacteria bacterium]
MDAHLRALENSKFACLWLDQSSRPEPLRPLSGDRRCELLIVGGGFTGMWAALQAKENNPELDIILIEATEIGNGASGRNGGFLSHMLAHGDMNAEYHFPGETQKLAELGRQNLRGFIDTLERYQIDARYENTGSIVATTRHSQNEHAEEAARLARSVGEDTVWLNRDEMRAKVDSPTYCGGIWRRGGEDGLVDPAYLCWGLKKTILALGVRVFERTPLVRLNSHGNGMQVDCPNGSVRCQKVLLATNAFRNPIRKARHSIIPVWDYVLATEPLSSAQREAIGWKGREGLSNIANMFHYYRMTHDDRITWGGGTTVCYYYGSGVDDSLADPRKRYVQLAKEFLETFPQLEGIRFTHRWSGIIGSSTRFCMAPGVAFDGKVAWSIGYTGLGVGATRFGARVGLELLGYNPSEILEMQFVRKPAMAWPPEPFRWIGVTLTRKEMARADRNDGKRGLWLKILDRLKLGFAC